MKVKDLVKYLKTLPQDYEVWGNDGYYTYSDYAFTEPEEIALVNEKDSRVDIVCSGS